MTTPRLARRPSPARLARSPSRPRLVASPLVTLAVLALAGTACGGAGSQTATPEPKPASTTVTLTAAGSSATSIHLAWTVPPSSSGRQVNQVFRRGGPSWTTSGNAFDDTGLQPETAYCYSVIHLECTFFIDEVCSPTSSAEVCATTLPDTTPPAAPGGLVATARGKSEVALRWSAPSDDVGVIGYRVYRGGALAGTADGPSFTAIGIPPNTAACFRVTALDRKGNESAPSAEACESTFWDDELVAASADGACYGSSMAISPGGALHVAYVARTGDLSYELRHATDAGGAWTRTTIHDGWGYPSIALDALGHVHVATHRVVVSNATGSWVAEPYDALGVVPSIAIDGAGHAHLAYKTEESVGGYPRRTLRHATNASGGWTWELLATASSDLRPAIALDAGGGLHAFYADASWPPYPLLHLTGAPGTWSTQSLATGLELDNCLLRPSVARDASGAFHVAAQNRYVSGAVVETLDAGAWCAAITVDASGTPHVAYLAPTPDGGTALVVATRSASGWSRRTVSSVPQPSTDLAIAVDPAGVTHVTFCNGGDVVHVKG